MAAVLVYLLAVLGACLAGGDGTEVEPGLGVTPGEAHGVTPWAAGAGTQAVSGGEMLSQPIVGFAISLHYTDDVKPYLQAVDDLAALGVNSLELVTPAFQQHGAAEEIRVVPGSSAQREHLLAVLQRAKARGMSTALMPIVLFAEPRGNEWRGKISPENWDHWWASYRAFLDYFLDVAVEARVDAFAVGSELLTTEKNSERWLPLIAHIRSRFPGRLYYSTNWDHYHVPTFWGALDMIGISCYWDMTTHSREDRPSPQALAQRWGEIRKQVLDFAAVKGKPVIFTELGYPSLPWGLKDPWNYVDTQDVPAAHDVQALGYRAFLDAWGDLLRAPPGNSPGNIPGNKPGPSGPDFVPGKTSDTTTSIPPSVSGGGFAGVYFYSWETWGDGGTQDTGYGIRGKPAYNLLQHWLRQHHLPAR